MTEYNISNELKEVINLNFEALVKCDSEEKIANSVKYYMEKNKLDIMKKELDEQFESVLV